MIYANFDPSLFVIGNLTSKDIGQTDLVLQSLYAHRGYVVKKPLTVPMTAEYLDKVYEGFTELSGGKALFFKEFKNLVEEILIRSSNPLLAPAGLKQGELNPDFKSSWITDDIYSTWLDCIAAGIFEYASDTEGHHTIASFCRTPVSIQATYAHPELFGALGEPPKDWNFWIATDSLDWDELECSVGGWPSGLSGVLVDNYAKRVFPAVKIGDRKTVIFEKNCLADISDETDSNLRARIIETVAAKAYNQLSPRHKNETIKAGGRERRLYVKRTAPPVRLHYFEDKTAITFTMYSSSDHDKGLS